MVLKLCSIQRCRLEKTVLMATAVAVCMIAQNGRAGGNIPGRSGFPSVFIISLPAYLHPKFTVFSSLPSVKSRWAVGYCPPITMGFRDPQAEATGPPGTPDPVEKGFATLNTIRYVVDSLKILSGRLLAQVSSVACADNGHRIGVKAMVQKVRLLDLPGHVIDFADLSLGWGAAKGRDLVD